jgi:hypothetical protein
MRGLKTALNLHPAEGIHPHEAQYRDFARWMGMDPATGAPIPFDCADRRFMQAYFELLHYPLEAQGVDFWWLDWQQGAQSSLPGLDPLWWLNHLHFYDSARHGDQRSFIFSRWGGLGQPAIQWLFKHTVAADALDFQPAFTATAANVAFGGGAMISAGTWVASRTTSCMRAGSSMASSARSFGCIAPTTLTMSAVPGRADRQPSAP